MSAANLFPKYIGISGLIGAGKTTIAQALADSLKVPVFFEPTDIDNEYLADFYKDMGKYSFPMQIYLLNKRFHQQQQIIWNGKGGVQDRTIYEDSVFAKMLMKSGFIETRDYETYLTLFSTVSNFMPKPNVIVHLDVSPEESLRRIKMRSRGCESTISLEYLCDLYSAYEDFLHEISSVIPVIRIDWNTFRPVEEVIEIITREYNKIHNRVDIKL
jgi:deoxyadenosine kinase